MIRLTLALLVALPVVACQAPGAPAVALPPAAPIVERLHHTPRGRVERDDELDQKLQGAQRQLRALQEQINPGPQ